MCASETLTIPGSSISTVAVGTGGTLTAVTVALTVAGPNSTRGALLVIVAIASPGITACSARPYIIRISIFRTGCPTPLLPGISANGVVYFILRSLTARMQNTKALHIFAGIIPRTLLFLLFSIQARVVGALQDCQIIKILCAVFRVPFVSHSLIPIGSRVCKLQNTWVTYLCLPDI